MLNEHFKAAYDNMFRFPNRFIAIVITVALSTFCLLGITSTILTMEHFNEYQRKSLVDQNLNYKQKIIQPSSVQNHVTPEYLQHVIRDTNAQSGYYYEPLSFYLWNYNYLIPWLAFNDKMLLETNPIMINLNDQNNYKMLKEKIIHGRFIKSKNEILISEDLLDQWIAKSQVLKKDGTVLFTDEDRENLQQKGGKRIEPKEILGEKVRLIYNMEFSVNEKNDTYQVSAPKSVQLTVVGIYSQEKGYTAPGNVLIPLSVKNEMANLSINEAKQSLARRMVLQYESPFVSEDTREVVKKLNGSIESFQAIPQRFFDEATRLQLRTVMYKIMFYVTVGLGLFSTIVISYLMSAERAYEFQLMRAIGADRSLVQKLFSLEIFLMSGVGALVGLAITLFLTRLDMVKDWLGLSLLLEGYITTLIVIGMPLLCAMVSWFQIRHICRQEISEIIKREGA